MKNSKNKIPPKLKANNGGSEMIATRKDVYRKRLRDGRTRGGSRAHRTPPPLFPPLAIRTAKFSTENFFDCKIFRPKSFFGRKSFWLIVFGRKVFGRKLF